jgi:hypothetical protein
VDIVIKEPIERELKRFERKHHNGMEGAKQVGDGLLGFIPIGLVQSFAGVVEKDLTGCEHSEYEATQKDSIRKKQNTRPLRRQVELM